MCTPEIMGANKDSDMQGTGHCMFENACYCSLDLYRYIKSELIEILEKKDKNLICT